ncbi:MAG: sugar kinase [Deltaproteobacteria bacterium]|nr:sugar kinase [Deltaproteobacteria bacterium]
MIVLAGTLPIEDLRLKVGEGRVKDGQFYIGDTSVSLNRGTAAMMAACCVVCSRYSSEAPYCIVSGDIGDGRGSIPVYDFLIKNISGLQPDVFVGHYIMPNLAYHNKFIDAIGKMTIKPKLIADAGFMYIAKMAGFAAEYTVFTPDLGELAFLADGQAPHPFYTRGFIFHMEPRTKELIAMAYAEKNAARFLFVKGERDIVCENGEVLGEVTDPSVPELEAIGGTGDTITGMIGAYLGNGLAEKEALHLAACVNRLAGESAKPTPATQIGEIVMRIPQALEKVVIGPTGSRC